MRKMRQHDTHTFRDYINFQHTKLQPEKNRNFLVFQTKTNLIKIILHLKTKLVLCHILRWLRR